MAAPTPHDAAAVAGLAAAWATFAAGAIAAAGGAYAGIKAALRRFKKWAGAWRVADQEAETARLAAEAKLNERVSTLAANHIHDLEAFRLSFEQRMGAHEQKDDERLARVHVRLDEVAAEMARRADTARIEGKVDQLLTGMALDRRKS